MDTDSIKTEWDLSLLYENPEEEIQQDIEEAQKAYTGFAEKYKNREDYLKDPKALKEALEELEYLGGEKNLAKPVYYYSYRKSLDAEDQEAESQQNKLSQLYSKLSNKIRFFELELAKLSEEKQKEFLAAEELKKYHKYLRWTFKTGEYNLDETAENILSITSLPRKQMWVDGVQKALNKKTIEWEGEDLPLPEANNKVSNLEDTKKRHELFDRVLEKLQEAQDFSESEINAVVTDKQIQDDLRGYEKSYSATILGYENSAQEVEQLVEVVTDNFDISHKFYDLKAELLDQEALTYADRNATIGGLEAEIPFKRAVEITHDAFAGMDEEFADILTEYLERGQIDVFPQEGKSGGAFCSSANYLPTYVLLNHESDFDSVTTLAHEMGHAIHAKLSKEVQPPMYRGHTISSTETASTFFEGVVFNRVFEKLDEDQKIIALHDRINRDISTIFRQVACFNFEKDLHDKIREVGSLSHEDIAKLMNKHMKSYLGDQFDLARDDGYYFINWGHIRRPFYVYAYAYGDLISKVMLEKYQDDDSYIKQIKNFLEAGSAQAPQDMFADIGIDTTDKDMLLSGIQRVQANIEKLQEMVDSN